MNEFEHPGGRERRRGIAWFRLAPLVIATLVGWGLFAYYWWPRPTPPVALEPGVGATDPLPPADPALVFASVHDRTPLTFQDNAAYATLLQRVRSTPLNELEDQCLQDVLFSELLTRPERYRGLPIRLQGTARRIVVLDDIPETLAPEGRLFEAWVFTKDSQNYPYLLIFEDAPESLPGGDDVRAFLIFHGYFFKLLAYQAADKARVAPMLVGRVTYRPEFEADADRAVGVVPLLWTAAPIALLTFYLIFRVSRQMRGSLGSRSTEPRFRIPPRDELSPEELSEWLAERSADDNEEESSDDEDRSD